jgi:hypothetical protein
MIAKQQAIYDIKTDKFKYLKREDNRILNRVDINELNKRLNKAKKSNFYKTCLLTILCLSSLIVLSLIGIKF